jgi:hypoxanthine-DNA glycosylase
MLPIDRFNARILVLGSYPGRISLEKNEYYAHDRNRFWPMCANALGVAGSTSYAARQTLAIANRIALWDVLESCERRGSLDSRIVRGSEIPNNFDRFIARHRQLTTILFNGRKAASLFSRFVVPREYWTDLGLVLEVLPSTSAANAAVSFEALTRQWSKAMTARRIVTSDYSRNRTLRVAISAALEWLRD